MHTRTGLCFEAVPDSRRILTGDRELKMTRLYHAVALALIFAGIPATCVAGDQLDELQNEVNVLMQKVDQLNARLHALKEQRQTQQQSTPATEKPAAPQRARTAPTETEPVAPRTRPAVADTTAERAPKKGVKPTTMSLDQAWKSLSKGMSAAELQKLLGEPTYKLRMSPNMVWYYTYRNIGSGSIIMSPDGRVIDWQHPPGVGGWW